MNSNQCHCKIHEIWDPLEIPTGRILRFQGEWPEAQVELFRGKKYDEVDFNAAAHDCFALNYFTPEARFYYLGSYLLFTNKLAEEVMKGISLFLDQRLFHALDILGAEIMGLAPSDPLGDDLAEILVFFQHHPLSAD